jgi:hypothetical protein
MSFLFLEFELPIGYKCVLIYIIFLFFVFFGEMYYL